MRNRIITRDGAFSGVTAIIISIALAASASSTLGGVTGEVLIVDGSDSETCRRVGERLTEVVNALETGHLESVRGDFTQAGYEAGTALLAKVRIENAEFTHRTRILQRPAEHLLEVRDIHVRVAMEGTRGDPNQFMVFRLTQDALLIEDMLFSVEAWHYRELIEKGRDLKDLPLRQRIVNFLEIFRTAYNRKDLSYLNKVYSDDALIIVGRVLQQKPEGEKVSEMLHHTKWNSKRIEFLRLSKEEYLGRLANIFQQNAFVRVEFDSIRIEQRENFPQLYGVNVKQRWYSSTYADTGYVFLMMDFETPEEPLIRVRCWQPEPFDDGSLPSVRDFIVVGKQ